MELITRQSLANIVSVKWKNQYPTDRNGVQRRLDALGKEKNPDDVDKIIGNKTWTAVPYCTECGKENLDFVVMVGQEPDYESSTAWLCRECIEKATHLTASLTSQARAEKKVSFIIDEGDISDEI